jgi:hypothetical protein
MLGFPTVNAQFFFSGVPYLTDLDFDLDADLDFDLDADLDFDFVVDVDLDVGLDLEADRDPNDNCLTGDRERELDRELNSRLRVFIYILDENIFVFSIFSPSFLCVFCLRAILVALVEQANLTEVSLISVHLATVVVAANLI